jgi:hypothetical protein
MARLALMLCFDGWPYPAAAAAEMTRRGDMSQQGGCERFPDDVEAGAGIMLST